MARENAGFETAKSAALFFGWRYDTFSQHERGLRGYAKSADRYAKAFKVSEGWLLTGEGRGPGEEPSIDEELETFRLLAPDLSNLLEDQFRATIAHHRARISRDRR